MRTARAHARPAGTGTGIGTGTERTGVGVEGREDRGGVEGGVEGGGHLPVVDEEDCLGELQPVRRRDLLHLPAADATRPRHQRVRTSAGESGQPLPTSPCAAPAPCVMPPARSR